MPPGAARLWWMRNVRRRWAVTSRVEVTGRDGSRLGVTHIEVASAWTRIGADYKRLLRENGELTGLTAPEGVYAVERRLPYLQPAPPIGDDGLLHHARVDQHGRSFCLLDCPSCRKSGRFVIPGEGDFELGDSNGQ